METRIGALQLVLHPHNPNQAMILPVEVRNHQRLAGNHFYHLVEGDYIGRDENGEIAYHYQMHVYCNLSTDPESVETGVQSFMNQYGATFGAK